MTDDLPKRLEKIHEFHKPNWRTMEQVRDGQHNERWTYFRIWCNCGLAGDLRIHDTDIKWDVDDDD